MDCLWQTALCDLQAKAMPLRRRLLDIVPDPVLVEAHVSVAPVHFGSTLFHLDEEGIWSVLIPMTDERGWIVNIAAFDPIGPRVATLNLRGFAVGLEELGRSRTFETGKRPHVHANMWTWLKAECRGVLPVHWRMFARYLLEHGVDGVIAPDAQSGRIIQRRLAKALTPPPVFVARAEVAA